MVLQRSKDGITQTAVRGWAREGDKISIRFQGREFPKYRSLAPKVKSDRQWLVRLPGLSPSNGEVLEVIGSMEKIVLTNVAVGDVWIIAPRETDAHRLVPASERSIDSDSRRLRFLRMHPRENPSESGERTRWRVTGSDSHIWSEHSSLAVYFGENLRNAFPSVPIGVVEMPGESFETLQPLTQVQVEAQPDLLTVSSSCYRAWQRVYRDFGIIQAEYNRRIEDFQKRGEVFNEPRPVAPAWPQNISASRYAPRSEHEFTCSGIIWWSPFSREF